MKNQNYILGLYKKFTSTPPHHLTDRVNLNFIENGYFLRKEGSEELFPSEGYCSPAPDLVTRINQEKTVTLYQGYEEVLDVTQKMIIIYTSLKETEDLYLLKAMKEASRTSRK